MDRTVPPVMSEPMLHMDRMSTRSRQSEVVKAFYNSFLRFYSGFTQTREMRAYTCMYREIRDRGGQNETHNADAHVAFLFPSAPHTA